MKRLTPDSLFAFYNKEEDRAFFGIKNMFKNIQKQERS